VIFFAGSVFNRATPNLRIRRCGSAAKSKMTKNG